MIIEYKNGIDFYNDNIELFKSNIHTDVFFKIDSKYLMITNKNEFSIAAKENNKRICVIRKSPYNTIYTGDKELVEQLVNYMVKNEFSLTDFSAPRELGIFLIENFKKYNIYYKLQIPMCYMKCVKPAFPVDKRVCVATDKDVNEIFQMLIDFCYEVNIPNCDTKEMVEKEISRFRLIRNEKEIVAISKICESSELDNRISEVYTRPKYRGKHIARDLVSTCVHEIISKNKFATLSVDISNPISSHIYEKIGFFRTFESGYFKKSKLTFKKI